jgi:hypothetical protein
MKSLDNAGYGCSDLLRMIQALAARLQGNSKPLLRSSTYHLSLSRLKCISMVDKVGYKVNFEQD